MTFDWSTITLAIGVLAVIVDFIVRVFSVILIPRNRRPQTATAWLLAIFFLPYLGIILFWLIGSRYLPKKRREKQHEINRYILETTEGMDLVRRDKTWPTWLEPVVALNRNLGAMPLVGGNSATLHDNYDESLIAMTRSLRTAKRYIHVEFYILNLDKTTRPFFDELEAAVKRGRDRAGAARPHRLPAFEELPPDAPTPHRDGRGLAPDAARATAQGKVPAP